MKPSLRAAAGLGLLALTIAAVSGCGTGGLGSSELSASAAPPVSATASGAGSTLVVTVPELLPAGSPASAAAPAVSQPLPVSAARPASPSAPGPSSGASTTLGAAGAGRSAGSTLPGSRTAGPAAPDSTSGEALNVSLANCEGCTVLATHRDVTGELSAALVGTGARAILLSVAAGGAARGVIGVPYGAAFPVPDGGVLACAAGICVVQGRQPDGQAILSAFELTDTGAWRDVSGDDAFPSATENGAVIDAGGRLAIAVQDQADGAAVWVLYTWDGTRYAVAGCAPDGPPPDSVDAVSPDVCLS